MTKLVGAIGTSFVYETPKGLNGPTGAVPELPAPDRLPPVFMGTSDGTGAFRPGSFVPCSLDEARARIGPVFWSGTGVTQHWVRGELLDEARARIAALEAEVASFRSAFSDPALDFLPDPQAKWPEPDSIYDDPVWSGLAFEFAQANPRSDHFMKQALQAALNQRDAARSRIAELEGMIRPGCSKTSSPEGGGHLIWWPDKMPVPKFNADESNIEWPAEFTRENHGLVARINTLETENADLRQRLVAFSDPAPADLPDPPRRPDGTLVPQPKPWTPPKQSEPQRRVGG